MSDSNLPWIEKYRPKGLGDLISHKEIISTLSKFLHEGRLPHLLFYGPPGTGKTSTILAVANQLYPSKQFSSMVLELNASDDRGIGVVREEILRFASTKTIMQGGFKLVILDEADAMTKDAQNALRRIIEKYTENTRFCLICNYLSKIIPAIQSRCTRFRFAPLSRQQMAPRIQAIVDAEKLQLSEDGRAAIVQLAQGDMRRAINILQSCSMAYTAVNEENVFLCVGHPLPQDMRLLLDWLLNSSLQEAHANITDLKTLKGWALQDILTELHSLILRVNMEDAARILLCDKLADIEYRLSLGCSEKLQLGAVLGLFMEARPLMQKSA